MRLIRARGSAKLVKIVSGSATQGLWLEDRKVGSRVIGEDQSRHPGRGTVGDVGRGGRCGRRASDRTKERVHRFKVRLGRERRAGRMPCFSLSLSDDRLRASGSGDVHCKPVDLHHFCEPQRKPYVFH